MNKQGKHTKPETAPRAKGTALSPKARGMALLCVALIALLAVFAIWRTVSVSRPPEVSAAAPALTQTPQETERAMLPYLADLYAQNQDLAGWIKIEGTRIDNPVLYTPNEDYYLYRGFDKSDNVAGSLYIDKRNVLDPRDDNLLLHGHNMKNGSMFHDLLSYKKESFYKEHKTIRFDTLYEEGTYEIVAVFVSKVYDVDEDVFKYYSFYRAENQQQFDEYIQNVKKLSLYDTGVTAEYGDTLITLSTCEYSQTDGRMVVVAKKSR